VLLLRRVRAAARLWAAVAAVVAASAAGCGKDAGEPRVPVFPVKGEIVIDGQPTPGAFLVFHPVGQTGRDVLKPRGRANNDGTFQVGTYGSADGAPVGQYKVTVEYTPLVDRDGDVRAGPNVVPSQYSKAETTPLSADVKEGENSLPRIEISTRS
jgi:hypothetical protein